MLDLHVAFKQKRVAPTRERLAVECGVSESEKNTFFPFVSFFFFQSRLHNKRDNKHKERDRAHKREIEERHTQTHTTHSQHTKDLKKRRKNRLFFSLFVPFAALAPTLARPLHSFLVWQSNAVSGLLSLLLRTLTIDLSLFGSRFASSNGLG
jgi:hypothetical protein